MKWLAMVIALGNVTGLSFVATATTNQPDTNPLSPDKLVVYGPLGVISAALLWFAWRVYKRETERADRWEVKYQELEQLIRDEYVPALEKNRQTMLDVMQDMTEQRIEQRVAARYAEPTPRRPRPRKTSG